MEMFANKDFAFKMMMTKETESLIPLQLELNYFSN